MNRYRIFPAQTRSNRVSARWPLEQSADTLVKMRVGDAISKRRGFKFLKGEIKTFKLMHQAQLINRYELYRNITQRTLLRLAPNALKKAFYKFLR